MTRLAADLGVSPALLRWSLVTAPLGVLGIGAGLVWFLT